MDVKKILTKIFHVRELTMKSSKITREMSSTPRQSRYLALVAKKEHICLPEKQVQHFPIPKYPFLRHTIQFRKRTHDPQKMHIQHAMEYVLEPCNRNNYAITPFVELET